MEILCQISQLAAGDRWKLFESSLVLVRRCRFPFSAAVVRHVIHLVPSPYWRSRAYIIHHSRANAFDVGYIQIDFRKEGGRERYESGATDQACQMELDSMRSNSKMATLPQGEPLFVGFLLTTFVEELYHRRFLSVEVLRVRSIQGGHSGMMLGGGGVVTNVLQYLAG